MKKTKSEFEKERDKIVKGLEETYRKLIEYKKRNKLQIVVIRNGKIVKLDADQVPSNVTYKRKSV